MKSLYSASAWAKPWAPPSRSQLSATASLALARGFSYLWRRQAEATRRSATTPNTVAWRKALRLIIDLLTPINTERRPPGPRSGAFRARQFRDRDCEKQPTL